MRIRRLSAKGLDSGAQIELEFAGRSPDLHIVFGPNEAGKSTVRQLLLDSLYGTESASNFSSLYGQGFVVSTDVEAEGRESTTIARTRYRTSLRIDSPLSETDIRRLYLAGRSRGGFELQNCFDHERLRTGGQSLLASDGDAEISLFAAASGITHLEHLKRDLAARCEDLASSRFRSNSTKKLIAAWNAYRKASEQVKREALGADVWRRDAEKRARLQQDARCLRKSIEDAERSQIQLTRLQRIVRPVVELRDIRSQMKRVRPEGWLDDAQCRRVPELLGRIERLQIDIAQVERDMVERWDERERIVLDERLLQNEELIVEVLDGLKQHLQRQREDVPHALEERERLRLQARHRLAEIDPTWTLEDATHFQLTLADRTCITRVIDEWREAQSARTSAYRERDERRTRHEDIRRQWEQQGELPDVDELRALVREVREHGNLDQQVQQRAQAVSDQAEKLARHIASQSLWKGTVDQLVVMPVPLSTSIERFAQRWDEVDQRIERVSQQEREAIERRDDAVHVLEQIDAMGQVPVEEDLLAARARRESGWQLVRQQCAGMQPDVEQVQAFAGTLGLLHAYEKAVADADETVDHMRHDAARTAEKASARVSRSQAERALTAASEELATLAQTRQACVAHWRDLWVDCRIEPLTPAEMKEWVLLVFQPVRDGWTDLVAARREFQEIEHQRAELLARLTDLSRAHGIGVTQLDTLAAVTAAAERFLTHIAQRADARQLLRAQWEEAQREARRAEADCERMDLQARSWEDEFEKLRVSHPLLPSDLAAVPVVLDALFEVQRTQEQADQRQAEIDQHTVRIQQYDQDLVRIAGLADVPIDKFPSVTEWAVYLRTQLKTAQLAHEQLLQADKELAKDKERCDELRRELNQLEAERMQLCEQGGCADGLALRELVQRLEQVVALDKRREELESNLRMNGDGLSVAELEQECDAYSAQESWDALPSQINAVREQVLSLGERLDGIQQELYRVQAQLAAWDGSQTAAVDSAQEAENHLATVDELWNEYVRTQLMLRVLSRVIADFGERNATRILQMASADFQLLTLGAWCECVVDYSSNDGVPRICAVNKGGQRKAVEQLSDGTRDQMFLALRLAFARQQAQTEQPLPLIMDDILVHFDDARTAATLQVLTDVARHTQILYFTHHKAVVDAARSLSPACACAVHQLP